MKEYFDGLFNRLFHGANFLEFSFLEVLCIVLAIAVVIYVLYVAGRLSWKLFVKIIKKIKTSSKKTSAKTKCNSITCPYCGHSLSTCICKSNQKKSYRARLKAYNKYVKLQKLNSKANSK